MSPTPWHFVGHSTPRAMPILSRDRWGRQQALPTMSDLSKPPYQGWIAEAAVVWRKT